MKHGTPGRSRSPFPLMLLVLAVLGAALWTPVPAAAHEIPPHVTVQLFVKPDGNRLHVLVRTPLASMRDVEFPLRGPGYLQIAAADEYLRDAGTLWIKDYIRVLENGMPIDGERLVSARVAMPSDRAFDSFERAFASFAGARLADDTDLVWQQALLDVRLEYEIGSEQSRFSIEPALAHLGIRTATVLRFLPPNGEERLLHYYGDPGTVELDPRWYQAARTFVKLGFLHILEGIDHLLFILCLVIPFRRIRPLVGVVTAFTIGHSITLGAAALEFTPQAIWFPALIETLIALSIVYMAFENIAGARLERRWLFAFGFGLVHGFGFSFLLSETLQFAGSHLAASLVAFNLGVELGQILAILVLVPLLGALFRWGVKERVGTILLSALVAHTAWHWMTERGAEFLEYPLAPPTLDAAFLGVAARWVLLLLFSAGVGWALIEVLSRLTRPDAATPAPIMPEQAGIQQGNPA